MTEAEMVSAIAALERRVAALEALSATGRGGKAQQGGDARPQDAEAAIDEMVAGALLRGQRTQGVLNGLFNVAPGLAGR